MHKTILLNELAPLLRREADCAAALLKLLQREREALKGRDADEIGRIAAEKEVLVRELDGHGARQEQLFRLAGIDPEREDLQEAIAVTGSDALSRAWQEVLNRLEECRHQNQINGAIVDMSQRFTQQVLDLIRGIPANTRLYGPSGASKDLDEGKPLASA